MNNYRRNNVVRRQSRNHTSLNISEGLASLDLVPCLLVPLDNITYCVLINI